MDLPTVSDRIKYLGDCAGSLRRLDKAAGLPFGHTHALTGRIVDPHLSTLHKVADGAGVARAWLTNGDGATPSADAVREHVAAACAGEPDSDDATDRSAA